MATAPTAYGRLTAPRPNRNPAAKSETTLWLDTFTPGQTPPGNPQVFGCQERETVYPVGVFARITCTRSVRQTARCGAAPFLPSPQGDGLLERFS